MQIRYEWCLSTPSSTTIISTLLNALIRKLTKRSVGWQMPLIRLLNRFRQSLLNCSELWKARNSKFTWWAQSCIRITRTWNLMRSVLCARLGWTIATNNCIKLRSCAYHIRTHSTLRIRFLCLVRVFWNCTLHQCNNTIHVIRIVNKRCFKTSFVRNLKTCVVLNIVCNQKHVACAALGGLKWI